jgi:DNA-directed RNA polymerase
MWKAPSGLLIKQSYLAKDTTRIKIFYFFFSYYIKITKKIKKSKSTLNISIVKKNEYDVKKQAIALMPNLIHYLDAASLSLVFDQF